MIPYQPKKLDIKDLALRPILDDISVVIPTLGRAVLEESLHWIVSGSAWPGDLIVIEQGDNAQVAGWIELLRSGGINAHHVHSSHRGRAAGLNGALGRVKTPFVAITDDDCFVDSNWLQNMANRLRKNPESIVTGRVEAAGEDTTIVVTSTTPTIYHKPRLKFDSMSGGNMGTSTVVVNKVGLFDEDPCMRAAEDAEWSYRALRSGISIIYDPDICVWHLGWRGQMKREQQYRRYALSHGGFYGKYLRKGDLFILLRVGLHYLRALRRWIKGRLYGDADIASMGRAYFIYLFPGILAGLRSRTRAGKLT
ncbi:MAG: glycosyltransferase [Anaerolineales bacterium]|jgi:GT2 family glycosyltransferase